MGASIISRVIGGVNETRIELNCGQFGRPVTLPTGWNVVRVGIRLDMTNIASFISFPQFNMGLGHGTTNMIGDATTDHFVGMQVSDQWDYTAGPPQHYTQHYGNRTYATKRVGTTTTFSASTMATFQDIGCGAAAGEAHRSMLFVTFTKGSPNYTLSNFWCVAAGGLDVTQAQFLTQMVAAVPAYANHSNSAARAIAVDEAVDGTLNAVQLYWAHNGALINICDLAVAFIS